MLSTATINITDAEWEVMRVVWANSDVTSRKVRDVLEGEKGWKSTTIKTLLGRLVDKGILETQKNGRQFIYTATVTEEESIEVYTDDILSRVCNKQAGKVIYNMVDDTPLSKKDISLLIELLSNKEKSAADEIPCGCIEGQCKCHLNKKYNIN